jgi:RNA polymerase sigma-70 factor, ECF subfamily
MQFHQNLIQTHITFRYVMNCKDLPILPIEQKQLKPTQPDTLDDSDIVGLCVQESRVDSALFSILIQRYEGIIYRVALRYLGIEADADDATQDTFLKAFRGLPAFRQDAEFKTWLFKILHNVCMTRLKQRSRRNSTEIQEDDEFPLTESATSTVDHYQQYIENDAIQQTLAKLSKQDRQILILRHIAELSLQEAADTLGLKLSATKMRFYRAQINFTEIYHQLQNSPSNGDNHD